MGRIERRYIDLTGAPDWVRSELLELAGEAEQARGAVAAEQQRARQASKRTLIGAVVAALISGLIGYWRGRRAAGPRVAVRSPK